jgi:hypothetical protein
MNGVISPAARLLLWCAAGTALVQLVLWRSGGNPDGFSWIFWYLLDAYDSHGNVLLFAVALGAFFLRRHPAALAAVRLAAQRPWAAAGVAFPLLCLGSLQVYHAHPLSMDEYSTLFQARVFAAGRSSGVFPAELLDQLIPAFFQNYFFTVSRSSGEVSSSYWPGFALLMAPFAWLGIPWAANPALGALTIPAVHRLAKQITGSQEAAGWAVALTIASPAFIVASISYYSTAAHLLCNLLYALLLLRLSVPCAVLAGLVGSLALTLHNPVPHLLFSAPFFIWLLFRGGSARILVALVLGYLPLAGLLGLGWHYHLIDLASAAGATAGLPATAPALADTISSQLGSFLTLPGPRTMHARIAGLTKIWTWGAAGLMVLAAYGYRAARDAPGVKLLGAAFASTFFGYFLVALDQGHGWGYRYIHSAWFVLPVLASVYLCRADGKEGGELRTMAAWGVVLSLLLADALRLVQVETFVNRHLAQVPPLARRADGERPEVVFVNVRTGVYTPDLVQNDPFLRGPRVTLVYEGSERAAQLMAKHFGGYARSAEGNWGEQWTAKAKPHGQ